MQFVPVAPWLDPAEQVEVVKRLLGHDLIRYSNARDLPLKSGGKTDIYINLRDARNDPRAMRFVAGLFENPLRRLGVRRFVEVPDSVSCFAPLLARRLGHGYITVRESAKGGRVAKASTIGQMNYGERVAMFDDVITDGASKVEPYWECIRGGLKVKDLVVLVDRQQGWRKKFAAEKIDMNAWPGMTLHDVRRFLIQDLGVMERCSPAVEEKNPIIVALDGKTWDEILPLIDALRPSGSILKVNDLLLALGADWLLRNLSVYGRVMADFKGHDIKNTLENYIKVLCRYPPWAVTVHASGGEDMMKAVVKALEGTPTKVLAVTVLTSFDEKTCEEIYTRLPIDQVHVLARIANRAGVHGFVCSPEEASELKARYPGKDIVTPGVRSPGIGRNDQERVKTPREAMDDGVTHLVMGRQILNASNPVEEVKRVMTEELGIAA